MKNNPEKHQDRVNLIEHEVKELKRIISVMNSQIDALFSKTRYLNESNLIADIKLNCQYNPS